MINVKRKRTTIKTKSVPEMMAEFSMVCNGVYSVLRKHELSGEQAKEFMQHNLKLGCREPGETFEERIMKMRNQEEKEGGMTY